MALKDIYRGMQNAAAVLQENFVDLKNLFVGMTGNQTVLGTKDFTNGIKLNGKSVSVTAKPTYEIVGNYWDGTGMYLGATQTVTIPNYSEVDEIVVIVSRYNSNIAGMPFVIPITPNVTKIKYDILFDAWEGSASNVPTIGVKRITLSISGTSMIITGDDLNTATDAAKKGVIREVGVRRRK